jgi:hypothetical protein
MYNQTTGKFEMPLTDGDICLLEFIHNSRGQLIELFERWDNSLTFESISVAEEYAKGRLSIVCYVELGGSGERLNFSTLADYKSRVNDFIVVVIMRANTSQSSDRNNWDQQPMLVHDVPLVKTPQGLIPSLVWFDFIDDQVTDDVSGYLYFSTMDGFYKFVSRVADREIGIPGWDFPRHGNNFTGHEVQGGSQVMDNVANNQRNFPWKRLGVERQDIIPREVIVDMQTVEIGFKKCSKTSLKLLDVLVGPFDF